MKDSPELVFTLPPQPARIDRDTKIKIYGSTLSITRDKRVIWLLNELGLSYELVAYDLFKAEHMRPEYLRIHASGLIPAIQIGEFYMLESVAIMMLLADRFPESGLAPLPDDVDRPAYLQWLFYSAATWEPVVAKLMHVVPGGTHPDPDELQHQLPIFDRYVITLEKMLESRDYLLARGFSVADMAMSFSLFDANYIGLLDQYPILKRYYERLAERPGFQAAYTGSDYFEGVAGWREAVAKLEQAEAAERAQAEGKRE
jgi:glutathione S-transferase